MAVGKAETEMVQAVAAGATSPGLRSWGRVRAAALLARANLVASGGKTLLMGAILAVGSLLITMGAALLGSIEDAMARSVTETVAGDLQVYSVQSKEQLALLGGLELEGQDVAVMEDFEALQQRLLALPYVRSVVPMGAKAAFANLGNPLDDSLRQLRARVGEAASGEGDPLGLADYASVLRQARQLGEELAALLEIQGGSALTEQDVAAVRRVGEPAFWADFAQEPLRILEHVENRVAPLMPAGEPLYLRYLGTDPEGVMDAFPRIRITAGANIPEGRSGILLNQYVYEHQFKLKAVQRLDEIHQALARGRRIALDPALQALVRDNVAQAAEMARAIRVGRELEVIARLQIELGTVEDDIVRLLAEFLDVSDGNAARRRQFVYKHLRQDLRLYKIELGEHLVLRGVTPRGYMRSLSLPVYGVFAFAGLADSPQLGALNITDMVTLRTLAGLGSGDDAEVADMRRHAGITHVDREDVEDALFGESAKPIGAAPAEGILDSVQGQEAGASPGATKPAGPAPQDIPGEARTSDEVLAHRAQPAVGRRAAASEEVGITFGGPEFDPAELRRGPFWNAAVVLEEGTQVDAAQREISRVVQDAALEMKVVGWQEVSGALGQFADLLYKLLLGAGLILLCVVFLIVSNTLLIATLERVPELGTLRAIGAPRRFLVAALLMEILMVSLLFGGLGSAMGAILVSAIGHYGVPAVDDALVFFFSGPRLRPQVSAVAVALGWGAAFPGMLLSMLYPAWIALRTSPREAMATED